MTKLIYLTFFSVIAPLSLFTLGGFTIGVSDCLLAALAYISALSLTATYGRRLVKTKLHTLLLLLILAALISYAVNLETLDVAGTLTTFLKWLAAWFSFFGIYYIFYGKATVREVERLDRTILLGGVIVLLLVAFTSYSPDLLTPFFKTEISRDALSKAATTGVVREFLPYWGTDRLAPFLALLFNIAFAHLVLDKSLPPNRKIPYLVFSFVVAIALIQTYTRAALAGTAVSIVMILLHSRSNKAKLTYPALVVLGCFLVVSYLPDFVLPYVHHREAPSYAPVVGFGSGAEKIISGNVLGRLYIASLGLKKFAEHPVFGSGFGTPLQGLTLTFGHAHDSYVSALYMLGIVGFVAYICVIIKIVRLARRATIVFGEGSSARAFAVAFYSWLIGMLVMSFSDSVLFWPYELVFAMMLVTAILCAVGRGSLEQAAGGIQLKSERDFARAGR